MVINYLLTGMILQAKGLLTIILTHTTDFPQKAAFRKGNPIISGKSRLASLIRARMANREWCRRHHLDWNVQGALMRRSARLCRRSRNQSLHCRCLFITASKVRMKRISGFHPHSDTYWIRCLPETQAMLGPQNSELMGTELLQHRVHQWNGHLATLVILRRAVLNRGSLLVIGWTMWNFTWSSVGAWANGTGTCPVINSRIFVSTFPCNLSYGYFTW